ARRSGGAVRAGPGRRAHRPGLGGRRRHHSLRDRHARRAAGGAGLRMTLGPLPGPGRPAGPVVLGAFDPRLVRLPTVEDTREFGAQLGAVLRAGDLVVLSGPLGAGKTTLVQGIGAGMGVAGRIASPTFVLARVHPAQLPGGPALIHVDAYRLGSL